MFQQSVDICCGYEATDTQLEMINTEQQEQIEQSPRPRS